MTVLVVTWNALSMLEDCIRSLQDQDMDRQAYRVVVVDNGSVDGTVDWVHEQPGVQLVPLRRNLGFAGGVSAGLAVVTTPFVALLNNDAVARRSWLRELLAPFADPMVGATTSKILLAGSEPPVIQSAGVQLDAGGRGSDRGYGEVDHGQFDQTRDAWGFCGGAAALRMDALNAVGGFWDRLFLYYEDVDVSWRLRRAGYTIALAPQAVAIHRHGASTKHGSDSFYYFNLRNRLLVTLANEPWRSALVRLRTSSRAAEGMAPTTGGEPPLRDKHGAPGTAVKVRAALGALWLAPVALRRRSLPMRRAR